MELIYRIIGFIILLALAISFILLFVNEIVVILDKLLIIQ